MEIGFFKKLINVIVTKDNEHISDKSDEELVNLYTKTGNESAFNEIVSRYANKIYGFALRITRNSSDAEEVFQEVFLTLTKKLDTFRGESKFSSWLYRVTVNASYMYLRSQKKHESNISLENYYPYDEKGTLMGRVMEKDWSSRPDIIIFSNEALKIIDKSINELPESYRTVFHLRDVEGLSNEEVADILEISIPAVKSRLHRARLFLRDRLSDYFHEWRR
ncbi:MAG: sigma-70 family RNA polymerase sigma factor [Thermodesulfobacteriota bacterium]